MKSSIFLPIFQEVYLAIVILHIHVVTAFFNNMYEDINKEIVKNYQYLSIILA